MDNKLDLIKAWACGAVAIGIVLGLWLLVPGS